VRARRTAGALLWGLGTALSGIGAGPAGAHPSDGRFARVRHDLRIRYVRYAADHVYHLRGYVGYEIDLQFAPGERFEGLGVGDAKAIKVAAAANHLFIKPVSAHVATDMTVLTNRRTYVFNYRVRPTPARPGRFAIVYAVRFEYPRASRLRTALERRRLRVDRDLNRAEHASPRNEDYWYCGPPALKPQAAWDDGAETHLIFPSREPLPAVFVRNADGSESLVNFDMRGDQMVIHRIARRFVLKRGRLTGCIVNQAFAGSGRRLASGTLSPQVLRVTRRAAGRRRGSDGTGGSR
jgi:type IV secretion system protein VirB9